MPRIYYEDIEVGTTEEFGSYRVTETEIIRFGKQYDPQPFHTDPTRARETAFGQLVASGWHTVAICMRLFVDHHLADAASLGGIGVDEIRWPAPLLPGDVVVVERSVTGKRVSESNPSRGIVRTDLRLMRGDGEEKLRMTPIGLYGRRPSDQSD
jgi:acyl dehydratase